MNETAVLDPETTAENEALIAYMVEQAKDAPEPGEMHTSDVLHKGDFEYPAPIMAGPVTSAGYVYIYDTLTGQPSLTNRNMLPTQLRKLRKDGSRVFDVKQRVVPKEGKVKCLLHASDPNRGHYDELGFGGCTKGNMANAFQRSIHMARRHKEEWAAIQLEREEALKEEDKQFQREMLRRQLEGRPEAPQMAKPEAKLEARPEVPKQEVKKSHHKAPAKQSGAKRG